MSADGAPKAVLIDVGGVILRWDPRTLYSKIFPDPAQRDWFLANVCTMAWHMRHDDGVPFADNRAPLLARHPVLARQIELRDPYVDPISRLQVELLHRYRTMAPEAPERPRLARTLMMSILGIAAGLRNAG